MRYAVIQQYANTNVFALCDLPLLGLELFSCGMADHVRKHLIVDVSVLRQNRRRTGKLATVGDLGSDAKSA